MYFVWLSMSRSSTLVIVYQLFFSISTCVLKFHISKSAICYMSPCVQNSTLVDQLSVLYKLVCKSSTSEDQLFVLSSMWPCFHKIYISRSIICSMWSCVQKFYISNWVNQLFLRQLVYRSSNSVDQLFCQLLCRSSLSVICFVTTYIQKFSINRSVISSMSSCV